MFWLYLLNMMLPNIELSIEVSAKARCKFAVLVAIEAASVAFHKVPLCVVKACWKTMPQAKEAAAI